MSKKTTRYDYRVEVYPKTRIYGISVGDEKDLCEEIVEQIKRHVDNVESIHVVWENEEVCEYCGAAWTEDDAHYNGGCCNPDIAQNEIDEKRNERDHGQT